VRVLIDARTVGRSFSGVGNYVFELVKALASLDDDSAYVLCLHGPSVIRDLELDERFSILDAPFSHESHPLGDLWMDFVLPRRAAQRGIDVIHGPAFLIPCRRTPMASVVSIHDLVAYTHAHTVPTKYALYMRWQIRRAARHATRIITGARSVARELEQVLGIEPDRIEAVHHGKAARLRPASPDAVADVRRRYGLERPFVLFVGNLEPRKNLGGLLRAFRRVRQRVESPLDLVIAGKEAWLSAELMRDLRSGPDRDAVRLLGYVPEGDLPALYAAAEVFAFPSFWEGFGLPVLEAMACNTPVVTSNTSSLPEVAGGAAVLVDPDSPESIESGLLEVLLDDGRREELRRRGLRRAEEMSWQRSAQETVRIYRDARDELS
jgi:glycosyltransferase involved in cell wall biosynthesis